MHRRLLISSALAALLAPSVGFAQGQGHGRPGEGRPPGGGNPGHGGSRPPPGSAPGQGGGGHPPSGGVGGHPPGKGGGGRPPGSGGGGRPPQPHPPRPPVPNGPYRPGGGRPPNFRPVPGPRWRYPPGYNYRRWNPGLILPSVFLSSAYFYDDYWRMGLAGPPYGYRWVRYGPDLLLVEIRTGRIVDVIYGAFY